MDFILRVFLYGLVGFVPDGNSAMHVLLPSEPLEHIAYLAHDNPCSGDCSSILVHSRKLNASLLNGHRIEIAALTGGSGSLSINRDAEPSASKLLPATKDEARSLSWVPTAKNVHGDAKYGKVKKECLDSPVDLKKCSLAARIHLKAGTLETCRLIQLRLSSSIYAYEFQPGSWTQAFTEVAVLHLPLKADELDVVLWGLADDQKKSSFTLTPKNNCAGLAEPCIDLFLANMPEVDLDIIEQYRGDHFAHVRAFMEDTPSSVYFPVLDGKHSVSEQYQPGCGTELMPLALLKGLTPNQVNLIEVSMQFASKTAIDNLLEAFYPAALPAPMGRPICTMVELE